MIILSRAASFALFDMPFICAYDYIYTYNCISIFLPSHVAKVFCAANDGDLHEKERKGQATVAMVSGDGDDDVRGGSDGVMVM